MQMGGQVLDETSSSLVLTKTIKVNNGAVTVVCTNNNTLAILLKVEDGVCTTIRDTWNAVTYSSGTLTINLTVASSAYGNPRLIGCIY